MTITVENRETPVLLLTGYLGSGKTTLVNRILSNRKGIKFAVIVNDIGEVNIDADLIQKGGVVDTTDDSLVPLQNGCICCTLKMDLVAQLNDLCRTNQFDYIVIEASGICEPAPIAQTICSFTKLVPEYAPTNVPKLDCIVTVVDALRMQSEFACGDSLKKDNLEEDDLENLVIQQIEFCNIVLLNKASEVKPEELGRVRGIVKALNPKVTILECDYGDIDLDKILNTKLFDFDKTATSAAWINAIEGEGNLSDQPEEDYGGHDEEHHGHPQEEEDDDHHHDKEDGHEEHEHEHEHHHHDEDGHCCCGHHHHHHHDHDADEVFTSWGVETAKKFSKADIEHALTELDGGKYGMILRSKGIVDGGADGWLEFDYVPGEWEVRQRGADVGGKLVVIGSKLDEKAIAALFGC